MRLSFLLPNEPSGCDNNSGAWYEASTMKHGFIIFRAGRIGGCFLFTYRPDEEGLLVLIEVKGTQQLGYSSARWVLFVGDTKAQVGGDGEPCE